MSYGHYYNVPKNKGYVPNGEIVHLKYSDTFAISSAAGVQTAYTFNLNSIFDPNSTGGGHQPYGRDQLATLYNYYQVYRCSWRISVLNTTSTAAGSTNTMALVCVVPHDGTSVPTYPGALEMPRAVTKYIPNNDESANCTVFKGTVHLADIAGISKEQFYSEPEIYGAPMTASPAEINNLNILQSNPDGNTIRCEYFIQLTYHCKVWEPVIIGPS